MITTIVSQYMFEPMDYKTQNAIHHAIFKFLGDMGKRRRIKSYGWATKDITVGDNMGWCVVIDGWRLRIILDKSGTTPQVDWDDKYNELVVVVRKALINEGFLDESAAEKMADKLHSEKIKLQNFEWSWDEDNHALEVQSTKTFLGNFKDVEHPEIDKMKEKMKAWGFVPAHSIKVKGEKIFVNILLQKIKEYITQSVKTSAKQMFLPTMTPEISPEHRAKTMMHHLKEPEIKFYKDADFNIYFIMNFELDITHPKEEVEAVQKYLRYLDRMWPRIVKEAIKVFRYTIRSQYEREVKQIKLQQEKEAKQAASLKSLTGPIKGKLGPPQSV